ncbi:glycosyltransferase family 4 protein [Haloarcula pelagica]|uniref:glycosyltransferase family 4 protein n=1 Tax=Haloarcula pelagica TaxID=3033389 RepID=UPI0024C2D732|nr:glycosyltransferase family 4 protein [Halomicroarcula sp. YJ-61-S]
MVPNRWRIPDVETDSPEAYYDTAFEFRWTALPCLDLLWLAPSLPGIVQALAFYIEVITFTVAAVVYTLTRRPDVVYTRSLLLGTVGTLLLRCPVVLEVHRGPPGGIVGQVAQRGFNRLHYIVAISDGLRSDWDTRTDTRILVAPDAVDPDRFDIDKVRTDVRTEFCLPTDHPVITYVGSLQAWKGVDTLIGAARMLTDVTICIVGGWETQQAELRRRAGPIPSNVRLVGHVEPEVVPRHLYASDVLVIPNTATDTLASRYTSPLKLFEYMAAERPIVASDIPAIREIVGEREVYFAAPDDPAALARTVETVLSAPDAPDRARQARERVIELHTWTRRAETIMAVLDS